jgi:hypothetical protein
VQTKKSERNKVSASCPETKSFDFIAPQYIKATFANYEQNAFVQFLFSLFPDCVEEIQTVLRMYFVGTYDTYTCFPAIDRLNRICRAKLIKFNPVSGKRLKGRYDTSSLPRKLKLKEDFRYKQIFFGEHLLSKFPNKTIAIVESEKSAIIASLCLPEFVWLATGSKQWLKTERLERLGQRQIILYPDGDAFDLWQGIAVEAAKEGLLVKLSALIDTKATQEQKANGDDVADNLITEQKDINAQNKFVDFYNSKLEAVINDESLLSDFETIMNEQKAVMIVEGGLSESEAERVCIQVENVSNIVLSL